MAASMTFGAIVNSIANSNISIEKKSTHAEFRTTRTGADKISKPVTVLSMVHNAKRNSIVVTCDDGNVRECMIARLPSVQHGRDLWKAIAAKGNSGEKVQFQAAGGFSADKWFYTIV